jgi:hypothetical protein
MVGPQDFERRSDPRDHQRNVPYQYQHLRGRRSIRVLELLPDRQGAPLRCHMREVSLDENPVYEAISYVWGRPDFIEQISCGDEVISITKSCSHVLHHLRARKRSRHLWIDACCIDQNSDQERNHQVGLMGDIYSNARRTLVWLGKRKAHLIFGQDDRRALRYISDVGLRVIQGKGMCSPRYFKWKIF